MTYTKLEPKVIYLFNGVTHMLEWKSRQMGDRGGSVWVENTLSVGDADDDGVNEIVVGTSTKIANGSGGHLYVYDGVTKELQWVSDYLGAAQDVGGDLFGLAIGDFHLAECHAIDRRPRTDQMNRGFAVFIIMASPQLFAINRNHFPLGPLAHRRNPVEEALLKLLGIQCTKDASKCVVGRNAMSEL